jgi:hypothetical protein
MGTLEHLKAELEKLAYRCVYDALSTNNDGTLLEPLPADWTAADNLRREYEEAYPAAADEIYNARDELRNVFHAAYRLRAAELTNDGAITK